MKPCIHSTKPSIPKKETSILPITIIIPTLDRHDLLLRAINYCQHFDCNILVADSSATKENCGFLDNFMYKHLPGMVYVKKLLVKVMVRAEMSFYYL